METGGPFFLGDIHLFLSHPLFHSIPLSPLENFL